MIAGLLLLSGGSNALNAQPSLGVSPATLNYTLATGSSQTQVITVIVAPNAPFTVAIPDPLQPYLSANPASGTTTPAQVSVTVNSTGLSPSEVPYTMSLTVVSGTLQQSVFISVRVTGSSSQIAANPASLAFSYQTGGAVPDIRDVIISSLTGSAQNFTVSVVSSGWLEATPASGNTASTNVVRVKATPGTLAAGAYDGTVIVTPVGGNPLQIPVRLTVAGAPQVSLNKTALSFVWQTGTPAPVAQTISATATNTDQQIFFNVDATTDTTLQWLVLATTAGVTPADIQVSVSPLILNQLAPGKYTGRVRVTSQTSVNPVQLVPVTLTISATPLLVLAPSSLQYNMAASGALPAMQKVTVASTSTALAYTANFIPASGGNWLTLSPLQGTSPSEIQATVSATAQSLLPGTYTGTINVISGTDSQNVPVTLTVNNSAVMSSSPGSLTFVYQTGRAVPADQFFTVSSTGGPISFTAAAASTGNWLSLSSAVGAVLITPSAIGVRANVTGLAAGTYDGTVTLTPVGGAVGATIVNVRLQVSASALLRIGANDLTFTVQPGGSQAVSQNLAVDSTGDPLNFSVSTSINNGANWLGIFGSSAGTTPANVNVSVNATGLTPGTYTGAVTITPIGGGPAQSVSVKLVVSAGSLAVSPSALTFTQFAGMAAPAAQTVNVTNPAGGALPFSVVSDSAWLTVTPSSGSAPAALAVVADGRNLLPGTYTGTITVQAPGASNSPQLIRATLTVMQQQTITIGVSSLSFSAQSPTQPPAAQPITVQGSTSGMTVKATATTVTGGNWLVVAPVEGAIPVTLNVSIAPAVLAGLAAGTYTGSIRIESPNTSNSPQTVGVTLTVAAALPSLLGVVNSASYLPGQLAPGEIVYVTGTNMGPAQLTIASPSPSFPTALAEVRVLFDGIAAPLLYVMNDKASAIVPWALAGRASTQVQVEYKGQKSTALNLQMGAVAPGIYSTAASGSGQGAILNQDYSYNGTAANTKRAAKGSVIMVYGTGGGVTTPAGIDGAITPGILYPLNVPATASLGGRTARVTYAGGAPGLVSGALQMNVEIPDDAPSGAAVPLVILIGGTPTQANLTVAIE